MTTTASEARARAFPDSDGVVRQDSGNSNECGKGFVLMRLHQRLDKMEICFGATLSRRRCSRGRIPKLHQVAKAQSLISLPYTTPTSCFTNSLAWYADSSLFLHLFMRKLTNLSQVRPGNLAEVRESVSSAKPYSSRTPTNPLQTESQKQPATSSSTPAA